MLLVSTHGVNLDVFTTCTSLRLAAVRGMYMYASTPHPTVRAVEMAAYMRDLAVV